MDKKAGILIPVFSVRSKESLGIGEFADLRLLSDFADKSGFRLIQLLPFFDTGTTKTWLDSYCYSVLSMFALHPIYIRIQEISSFIAPEILEELERERFFLNKIDAVDYEKVYALKIDLARRIYEDGKTVFFESPEFKTFFDENRSWLCSYAVFSSLRDFFGNSDFQNWPKYREGTIEIVEELRAPGSPHYQDVCFYYFLQFHLERQFKEAVAYARGKGVLIKGDFPIGVHVNSVDNWSMAHIFNRSRRIGAPPDYFNTNGQNWELVAYNWEQSRKQGYTWFIQRLKHLEKFCDLVRIDHILGYFRFWEIPERHTEGGLGYFCPSLHIRLEDLPKEIAGNLSRYVTPFITDEILQRLFGSGKDEIIKRFFEKSEREIYRFKSRYFREEEIESAIDLSNTERFFLSDLYANVILIQDGENQNFFYPRMGFEKTLSFSALNQIEKESCKQLNRVYFSDEEEALWRETGMERLKIFKDASTMEICAEDLGMIPRCTEKVLEELGFLRLHIQRMPRNPKEEFSLPSEYEYLSVCSPSNHDTSTLRMWWKEDPEKTQKFYEFILKEKGSAPLDLDENLARKIIEMHLNSGSKFAIFLMQDLLAMSDLLKEKDEQKERINNPAVYPFYWKWRLHLNLEDLMKQDAFCRLLRTLVEKSGRVSTT